jgi:predicted DNA-binding antitoxin AbrB/MazE fold protein
MNLNEFARRVTLAEGGRVSVSIAQVKEIMRIIFRMMARMPMEKVVRIVKRFEDR